jgi:hypothetical protein
VGVGVAVKVWVGAPMVEVLENGAVDVRKCVPVTVAEIVLVEMGVPNAGVSVGDGVTELLLVTEGVFVLPNVKVGL